MSLMATRFDRYVVFVTPFLAILAGLAIDRCVRACATFRAADSTRSQAWITPICAILILGFPLYRGARFSYHLSQPDTREQALLWIPQNLPKENPILILGEYNLHHGLVSRGTPTDIIGGHLATSPELLALRGKRHVLAVESYWHQANNYRLTTHFDRYAKNYERVQQLGRVVHRFEVAPFESGLFAPHSLEPSATANVYHNPTLVLYELATTTPSEGAKEVLYSASSLLPYSNGELVADPDSSSGVALAAGSVGGPYEHFLGGEYTARFTLKTVRTLPQSVVSVDVAKAGGGTVYGSCPVLEVGGADRGGYRHIVVPFVLPESRAIEFRVHSDGAPKVWIDRIQLTWERPLPKS